MEREDINRLDELLDRPSGSLSDEERAERERLMDRWSVETPAGRQAGRRRRDLGRRLERFGAVTEG